MNKIFTILTILTIVTLTVVIIFAAGCKKTENDHHNNGKNMQMGKMHHKVMSMNMSGKLSGKIKNGVRVITMTAKDFAFQPNTIVVKKGEKIRLLITSKDVTHGIGISQFNVNQTLPPNQQKKVEFTASKSGNFHFHCSVYCGSGHGRMHGMLIVKENK